MVTMIEQEIEKIFGKFQYEDNPNGSIKILGNWTKKYITKSLINNQLIWHHKFITKQIHTIKEELKQVNLLSEFDLSNGGGCFVPRHKCWDLKRGLSCHSWGIAIDIDPKKHPYGSDKKPHPVLIEIFKKNGFIHGGDWRSKDQMHFQFNHFV